MRLIQSLKGFFIFFLLVKLSVTTASATSLFCNSLLVDEAAFITEYRNRLKEEPNVPYPLLELVGEIESESPNGPRFTYRVADPTQYYSTFGFAESNPHGAHQVPALVTGLRVARILGLEFSLTTHKVILPGARRIMAGIRMLNRHLPADRQIEWSFYEDSGKSDGMDYLYDIVEDLGLPISSDLRIHDINFHLGTVVMPIAISNRIRTQTRELLLLKDHLESAWQTQLPHYPIEWLDRALLNEIISRQVNTVDVTSGNFSTASAIDNMQRFHDRNLTSLSLLTWPIRSIVRIEAKEVLEALTANFSVKDWILDQLDTYYLSHTDIGNFTLSEIELSSQVSERRSELERAALAVEAE